MICVWDKVDLSEIDYKSLISVFNNLNCPDLSPIKFIFTDVEEAFSSQLFVIFISSFIAIIPFFFYNFFCCIKPCLYNHEKTKMLSFFIFLFASLLFVVINVQITIIPKLLQFLLQFEIINSTFLLLSDYKIASFLNWSSKIFTIIFSVCFFFVLAFLFTVNNLQAIKNKTSVLYRLTFFRKVCVIALLLFSAIVSPPDLIFQLVFYFFLVVLLELAIWFIFIYNRKFFFANTFHHF